MKTNEQCIQVWRKMMRAIIDGDKEQTVTLLPLFDTNIPGHLLQVMGDLLWAAGDDRAMVCYQQAYVAYERAGDAEGLNGVKEQLRLLF